MATGSRENIFVCTFLCVSSEMWDMFPHMPFLSLCISYFSVAVIKAMQFMKEFIQLWFQRHKSSSRHGNRAPSNRTAIDCHLSRKHEAERANWKQDKAR